MQFFDILFNSTPVASVLAVEKVPTVVSVHGMSSVFEISFVLVSPVSVSE